jgi:hypothetical protein
MAGGSRMTMRYEYEPADLDERLRPIVDDLADRGLNRLVLTVDATGRPLKSVGTTARDVPAGRVEVEVRQQ